MTLDTKPTAGRIRLREEQAEWLARFLHAEWVRLSRTRASTKAALGSSMAGESALIENMNREMRLVTTIQEEVERTQQEMGWTIENSGRER